MAIQVLEFTHETADDIEEECHHNYHYHQHHHYHHYQHTIIIIIIVVTIIFIIITFTGATLIYYVSMCSTFVKEYIEDRIEQFLCHEGK